MMKFWAPNFRRLVLLCMDSYDSESRRIFQHFSRSTRFILPRWGKKKQRVFCFHPKRIFWHVSEARGKWNKCCVVLHFLECSATFVSAVEQMLHTSSSSTVLCNICSQRGTSIAWSIVTYQNVADTSPRSGTNVAAILVPSVEQMLYAVSSSTVLCIICSAVEQMLRGLILLRVLCNICSRRGTSVAW